MNAVRTKERTEHTETSELKRIDFRIFSQINFIGQRETLTINEFVNTAILRIFIYPK